MSGAEESGRREFVIGGLAIAGSLNALAARAQPMAGMRIGARIVAALAIQLDQRGW